MKDEGSYLLSEEKNEELIGVREAYTREWSDLQTIAQ